MQHHEPPKYALRFLRWFCHEDYLEEIEGNLVEVYEMQYEESERKSRCAFYWNVLRHFRPAFIRSFQTSNTLTHPDMIRYNFLIALRNFQKHRGSFLINLTGLSTGLACALMIYLWVSNELSIDKFHENDARLYQVIEHQEQANEIITLDGSVGVLAEALEEDFPEVEYATTVTPASWFSDFNLEYDEKQLKAGGQYVGEDFFNVFSYELLQGAPGRVLQDKHSIVISEALAMRIFNTTENIVGKELEWSILTYEEQAIVSGVFADVPSNSSSQFDFVVSFEVFKETMPWVTSWGNTGPHTYVVLEEQADFHAFNAKIDDYISTWTDNADFRSLEARLFSDTYLYGTYKNGLQTGGRIEYVRLFSLIGIFILLIACINFMNLSTARATRRAREVGVKKSMGVGRSPLVVQYLTESLLLTLFSLLAAFLMVSLLLPEFNNITGKELGLSLSPQLLIGIMLIMLLTALLAGSYPAFYLSSFNPVAILRGKVKSSSGEAFARKGLVILQFSLSAMLIVAVWIVYEQISFVQSKNLGYNKEQLITFPAEGAIAQKSETFLQELKKLPEVQNASTLSNPLINNDHATVGLSWPGKNPDEIVQFQNFSVGYDMIETLGLEVAAGRSFSRNFGSDSSAIIFNEKAVELMGLEEPIGATVNLWGDDRTIVGVVENFHFESLHQEVKPLFFKLDNWSQLILARLESGSEREALAAMTNLYQQFNPGYAFDFNFVDADYQELYAAEQRVSTLSRYFAVLGILISCLGLFGLAAFTAERRTKEIGIRKALGSGRLGIVYLLSRDFIKTVLIAILIAIPGSYLVARQWLSGFAFRIDLQWWYFVGVGVLVLLIAWLTVSLQTFRAARVNPVDCLRSE